jgi:hypothetical protein
MSLGNTIKSRLVPFVAYGAVLKHVACLEAVIDTWLLLDQPCVLV